MRIFSEFSATGLIDPLSARDLRRRIKDPTRTLQMPERNKDKLPKVGNKAVKLKVMQLNSLRHLNRWRNRRKVPRTSHSRCRRLKP